MTVCKNCGDPFTRTTHNQVYCGVSCRKEATNENVLARYYERKRKRNTRRICEANGCEVVLSRYNMDDYCSVHQSIDHQYGRLE